MVSQKAVNRPRSLGDLSVDFTSAREYKRIDIVETISIADEKGRYIDAKARLANNGFNLDDRMWVIATEN